MPFLNLALEDTLIDYMTGSLDPQQLTASYYTGYNSIFDEVGNIIDIQAPAVIVEANESNEVYYKSNVYEVFVNIKVYEMAADISSSLQGGLGILSHNIQNMFWDSNIENNLNNTSSHGFVTYQCQSQGIRHYFTGDALVTDMGLRVVGTLSGSLP